MLLVGLESLLVLRLGASIGQAGVEAFQLVALQHSWAEEGGVVVAALKPMMLVNVAAAIYLWVDSRSLRGPVARWGCVAGAGLLALADWFLVQALLVPPATTLELVRVIQN